MLSYRLTNCEDCASIPTLLNEIDCKLTELGNGLYSNIVYGLRMYISSYAIADLLHYKRILQYKKCNPEYASCYSVEDIASKVKLLIFK